MHWKENSKTKEAAIWYTVNLNAADKTHSVYCSVSHSSGAALSDCEKLPGSPAESLASHLSLKAMHKGFEAVWEDRILAQLGVLSALWERSPPFLRSIRGLDLPRVKYAYWTGRLTNLDLVQSTNLKINGSSPRRSLDIPEWRSLAHNSWRAEQAGPRQPISTLSHRSLPIMKPRCTQTALLSPPAGADQSRIMQEQMSGAAMAMPADTNKAFKVHSAVEASSGRRLRPARSLLGLFLLPVLRRSGRHWSWLTTSGHWRTLRRTWWAESWTWTACSPRSCQAASSDGPAALLWTGSLGSESWSLQGFGSGWNPFVLCKVYIH